MPFKRLPSSWFSRATVVSSGSESGVLLAGGACLKTGQSCVSARCACRVQQRGCVLAATCTHARSCPPTHVPVCTRLGGAALLGPTQSYSAAPAAAWPVPAGTRCRTCTCRGCLHCHKLRHSRQHGLHALPRDAAAPAAAWPVPAGTRCRTCTCRGCLLCHKLQHPQQHGLLALPRVAAAAAPP